MILYRLYLSAEEHQTLEGWQKKYKSHSPKLQRIQIILDSDEQTADPRPPPRQSRARHQRGQTFGLRHPSLPQQVLDLQRPGYGFGLWYLELASDQKERGYLGTGLYPCRIVPVSRGERQTNAPGQ